MLSLLAVTVTNEILQMGKVINIFIRFVKEYFGVEKYQSDTQI
jgi:hypothetical protein